MELCIASALKSTGIRWGTLSINLPPDTSHCMFLVQCQRENLLAHSAKGAMVVIQNSLVTVFVTNVCQSCQPAAVHVTTYVLVCTFPIALVDRVRPILAQNTRQINNICRNGYRRFAIYLHRFLKLQYLYGNCTTQGPTPECSAEPTTTRETMSSMQMGSCSKDEGDDDDKNAKDMFFFPQRYTYKEQGFKPAVRIQGYSTKIMQVCFVQVTITLLP